VLNRARPFACDRIGVARLATMAFNGQDMLAVWKELAAQYRDVAELAGVGMDLSILAQLFGDPEAGLNIQHQALLHQRLYRSPCEAPAPRLQLLALAAELDMGSNTPVEYLIKHTDIELTTLYIVPGLPLPEPLPAHDVAIVVSADDDRSQGALHLLEQFAPHWPRPILNRADRIRQMDRDRLYHVLKGIAGLQIPATERFLRDQLPALKAGALHGAEDEFSLPIVIRPISSHAGKGLARIENADELDAYLASRPEPEFFVSPYIDYCSADGLFRKYRVVCVDGRPYACHMAILDKWNIWYLNADMVANEDKRRQEADFMDNFDEGFGRRHAKAFDELCHRLDLDYFMVDCAETKSGELLIFEADNTAIVHDMDPPDIFPYKVAQMRKVFDAFVTMLYAKAGIPKPV
jgi:hypothetical protein